MQGTVSAAALVRELKAAATPARAAGAARYFKTGPGQYGEGDIFLGVTVPDLRRIVSRYRALPLSEVTDLLHAGEHECRAAALLILVAQYGRGDSTLRQEIFDLYLANTRFINNWDLVDVSCREIVGAHLLAGLKVPLTRLVRSANLWERRIAIISTMPLARNGNVDMPLRIARMLLTDKHDLIHKAIGWVLRGVGDANRPALVEFLTANYERIPRTALRYAVEHFPPDERRLALRGEFVQI